MKAIYPDLISAIVADEADADYPITNVEDDYPKRVWKATSAHATVTLTVASGSSAVAFFGSNAATATIIVAIGNAHTIAWASGIVWTSGIVWNTAISSTDVYDVDAAGVGSGWSDYTDPVKVHVIQLYFEKSTGIIEAGIIRAGTINSFNDPLAGIKEGLYDYSIIKELENGSWYVKKRDIVRTFGFELILDRDTYFYNFMHKVALLTSYNPLAWRVATGLTNFEWIVFARFGDMPSGSHNYPDDSVINASLIEVI